jgi:N-acetylneuraminic acid mutarotase
MQTRTGRVDVFHSILCFLVCISLAVSLFACSGGGGGSSSGTSSGTGGIAFSIVLQGSSANNTQSSLIACSASDQGVATISANVYNSSNVLVASGTWSCSAHSGTLNNVPAGSNYQVIITAYNTNGVVTYSGQLNNITVQPNKVTNGGQVTCFCYWCNYPPPPTLSINPVTQICPGSCLQLNAVLTYLGTPYNVNTLSSWTISCSPSTTATLSAPLVDITSPPFPSTNQYLGSYWGGGKVCASAPGTCTVTATWPPVCPGTGSLCPIYNSIRETASTTFTINNCSSCTDSVSGNVFYTGTTNGVPKVSVTLTPTGQSTAAATTATTATNGSYSFTETNTSQCHTLISCPPICLLNGSYTLTPPSIPGYTCTPASIPISVNNSSLANENFYCTANSSWIWESGSNQTSGATPACTPSTTLPGARFDGVSWFDSSNNFYLFGGGGYDQSCNFDLLNDLWRYDGTQWTFIGGSSRIDAFGTYATPAFPGARKGHTISKDSSGNVWLFGGIGYGSGCGPGGLNELWKYDGTNWHFVSGTSACDISGTSGGNYGTINVSASTNVPPGRAWPVSWFSGGDFWLFGGMRNNNSLGNDLWKYNVSTGQWTWVSGLSTWDLSGTPGGNVYTSPNATPGWRYEAVSWTDLHGNLWLFGGGVTDSSGNLTAVYNDLWEYNPVSGVWTWVSGSNTPWTINWYTLQTNQTPSCGTINVSASSNVPGGRYGAVSWTDSLGNLWLFGGAGVDCNGKGGYLNDLWKYNVSSGQWTWVSGSYSANPVPLGNYGTMGVAASTNVPGARWGAATATDSYNMLWLFGGGVSTAYTYPPTPPVFFHDLWRYNP